MRGTSRRYPWYDSVWLERYLTAKALIADRHPAKLPHFLESLAPLRTRPDFHTVHMPRVFDDGVLAEIREVVRTLKTSDLDFDEVMSFGRLVAYDHPFFSGLQRSVVDLVSDAAGEAVEPGYNFLSMYTKMGVCGVHMDSPEAKWTLDICVDASDDWPIHLSQVVPWPENFPAEAEDWDEAIRTSPAHRFTAESIPPGQAILFSGSSQWHYRDALAAAANPAARDSFCHLLFFHFVPKGTRDLVRPSSWGRLFDVPELI